VREHNCDCLLSMRVPRSLCPMVESRASVVVSRAINGVTLEMEARRINVAFEEKQARE
jgi:hypothetical protein